LDLRVRKTLKNCLYSSFEPVFGTFSYFSRFSPISGHFCRFFLLNKTSDERVGGGPSFSAETPLSPLNSDTLRTMTETDLFLLHIGPINDGRSHSRGNYVFCINEIALLVFLSLSLTLYTPTALFDREHIYYLRPQA
jgi:hypothetical protein